MLRITWGNSAMRRRKLVFRFLSEVAVASLLIRLLTRLRGASHEKDGRAARCPESTPVGDRDLAAGCASTESPAATSYGEERQPDEPHNSDADSECQTLNSSPSHEGKRDSDDSLRNRTTLLADNSTVREARITPSASATNSELPQIDMSSRILSSETPQHSPSQVRDETDMPTQTPVFERTSTYRYTRQMGVTRFVRKRILRRDDPYELGLVCKTCHIELPKSGRCDFCE